MWLQDSIRSASNLRRSREGPCRMDRQWAPSDGSLRCGHPPFPSIQVNERYLYERTGEALGLLYAMHWPFFNRKPAGVSDVPCFMTVSKMQEHVLGKWPDGNGPTGLPRKAWNHVTSTLTADRTGSKLLHQSTLLFGKMSDFLTCLHLENSWSRAGRRKSNEPDLRESGCVEPGKVVYTAWLNERGGFETDLTVTRLSERNTW